MAGSPSHSVRDIQEPPRSWVGVCAAPRTVLYSGRTRNGACLFRLGQYCGRSIRNRAAATQSQRRRRRDGTGGQSLERPAQAAGEIRIVLPPLRDVCLLLIGRFMRPHGATVRRAKSRRLTYCFDRLRMRTLGSLTTVPETPVVRNARQPFVSDDPFPRRNRSGRNERRPTFRFHRNTALRARRISSVKNRAEKMHPAGKRKSAEAQHLVPAGDAL
jgi:hypothetical protein